MRAVVDPLGWWIAEDSGGNRILPAKRRQGLVFSESATSSPSAPGGGAAGFVYHGLGNPRALASGQISGFLLGLLDCIFLFLELRSSSRPIPTSILSWEDCVSASLIRAELWASLVLLESCGRSLMVDSEAVDIPSGEVPSQPETDGDVGTARSSTHGLKQLSGTNREEHEMVLKRSLKRRRVSVDMIVSPTDKENLINEFRTEMDDLFKYFNAVLVWKWGSDDEKCCSMNSAMACMLEGSNLPFSRLADEIYEKLKAKEIVSLASVHRDVHFISSRLRYGMDRGNEDFFEDESESSLWCWESWFLSPQVRDVKLLPKHKQKIAKTLRKGREKVRERIAALSEILSILMAPENQASYMANFPKASEKLSKTLSMEEIRLLVQKLMQKSEDEIAKMESKTKARELLKEIVTNRRNVEKEMKKHDRELQQEKSQSERELKRRQTESEKEERCHKKEEAEAKKMLSIQKQASLMERFLKSKKNNNLEKQGDRSSEHILPSDYSGRNFDMMESTLVSMDSALSQQDSMNPEDLWKSHIASWHKMRHSNKSQHWGIRRKPKTKVINELKLQGTSCEPEASRTIKTPRRGNACSGMKGCDKSDFSMFLDEIEEETMYNQSCQNNDYTAYNSILLPRRATKLLQFDKSYRPAYYGSWSKKSVVVGSRHPFAKDNDLDYDFDSDEEWEEEEPGESLSNCDKDDEEEILEEGPKADDEDESEDSFFVPDGYLSEDEGVHDGTRTDCMSDVGKISPRCILEIDNGEFFALLRQQKYLDSLTQQALQKNQPLIITNLLHEKSEIITGEDLNGTSKIDQICLHTLCMVACPGGPIIEEPLANQSGEDPNLFHTQNKDSGTPVANAATISDPCLSEYVSCIQSTPNGMAKVIESLHQKFPSVSKTKLRNKVREICDFVNNRWQVKKEVLDKLGMSVSQDEGQRPKGIATFFLSKQCLPLSGEAINLSESSPLTCPKVDALDSEDSHHGN